jgi:hypothetical protein
MVQSITIPEKNLTKKNVPILEKEYQAEKQKQAEKRVRKIKKVALINLTKLFHQGKLKTKISR